MEYSDLDHQIAQLSIAHRRFVHPLLRALLLLGGSGRKKEVTSKVRELLEGQLTPKQLDYLIAKGRFGWVRFDLKTMGLIGGEYGTWALTEVGRTYAEAHRNDPIRLEKPELIPELGEEDRQENLPRETVTVTAYGGYEIPLLQVMADGITKKAEIMNELEKRLSKDLLPGDKRRMPSGPTVLQYRASWALSNLGQAGEAANFGTALWRITDSGRDRLAKESEQWSLKDQQNAKAAVVTAKVGATTYPPGRPPSMPSWKHLESELSTEVFTALQARLRPDLGPTPERDDLFIPRNVILYGPPGTGKTYIARRIAEALTAQTEPDVDEARWRIVQFHPSYAYEDFVQGMRPDLEGTQLRYRLHQGPFLNECTAASQDPDAFFVLIIDEINRGDPARIFGELLYALEYRDQPVALPSGGYLTVPPNLVVLGTMNSVDRSVALVDYALRRRFGFIRIDPDPSVITDIRGSEPEVQVAARVMDIFNQWLGSRLGREHRLGHSFFLNPAIDLNDRESLERIWSLDVHPLLEEYFFGEPDSLAEAQKTWRAAVDQASADLAAEGDENEGQDASS